MSAEYVFTFDVIAADSEGYYIDRWDRSNRYEVIGATKKAALAELWPIVGTAPSGHYWKARQVGTAKDVRLFRTGVAEQDELRKQVRG